MPDQYSDVVENEVRARSRNEWIEQAAHSFGQSEEAERYVCECSYVGCTDTIGLHRDEYEAVRVDGIRFVIAINHENPEMDLVISENGRFAVVEKWMGEARRIANDTNPRLRWPPASISSGSAARDEKAGAW